MLKLKGPVLLEDVSVETLLARIAVLEDQVQHLNNRSVELEAGIVRMAVYLGCLHELKRKEP